MKFFIRWGFSLFFLTALVWADEKVALPFDHSLWDQFLKKFVNEKGEVNYRSAQKEPELLHAYLEKLKSFSGRDFKEWPREERIALLINAYNAGVVKTILSHYPVKSVLDVPGGWDQAVVQIGKASLDPEPSEETKLDRKEGESSRTYSLNQIENQLLRRAFRDEKILFALSRAARGSPRLRQEAYEGPKLEGQLYLATREFVNDPAKNRIVPGEKKIVLSRLFQWVAGDFLVNWGNFPEEAKWNPGEMAVLSFLAHTLVDPEKVEFLREGTYKIKYEVFDWRLNESKT